MSSCFNWIFFARTIINEYFEDSNQKKRIPKITEIQNYDNLTVNLNRYEDYFEEGFQDNIKKYINEEIIPELIQTKCNSDEIYKKAKKFINDELLRNKLVVDYTKVLETIIVPNSLERISNYLTE